MRVKVAWAEQKGEEFCVLIVTEGDKEITDIGMTPEIAERVAHAMLEVVGEIRKAKGMIN